MRSIRYSVVLLSFVAGLVGLACAQEGNSPGQRFALVIGNANYQESDEPLKTPINDARAMAEELRQSGFDVELGQDLSRTKMLEGLNRLCSKIKSGSAVVFFFSGYGIQANRQTYLLPVDGHIWTEGDVGREGIDLELALAQISACHVKIAIAIIDASRRSPFERRFRKVASGLAPVVAPDNTLVMYSAAPGSIVNETVSDNGSFVQELLKEIRVQGLSAEDAFNRARVDLQRASGGAQTPWLSNLLTEPFSFKPVDDVRSSKSDSVTGPPTAVTSKLEEQPIKKNAEADAHANPSEERIPVNTLPPLPPDPVIESLNSRIDTNPKDTAALYRRGQLFAKQGDFSRAVKDFNDLLRLDPSDVDALNNRCWSQAMLGELGPALQDCNTALRLRPRFPEALDTRGLVNLKLGLDRNAITDYDSALQINANLASALYGRGIGKKRIGDVVAGERDIDAAKAMRPAVAEEFKSYGVQVLPDKSYTRRTTDAAPAKIRLPEPILGLWCSYGSGEGRTSYLRNDASGPQPDTPCTKEGGTEWIVIGANGDYNGRDWQCRTVATTIIDRGQVIKGQPGANAVYGLDARCEGKGQAWRERARIEVERWGSALTIIRRKE